MSFVLLLACLLGFGELANSPKKANLAAANVDAESRADPGLILPTSRQQGDWPPNLTVQLGPAEVIRGPDTAADNPFSTLPGSSTLFGYLANSTTVGYIGGSLETLRLFSSTVLQPGTGFDSCGAWLNSTWQDGSVTRAWYHAETACNYPTTHKSVAYAESYDGGRTFVKPSYPANQVITAPPYYTDPDEDDEGDHRVLRVGDYLYLYFIPSRDWQLRLARSHVADGGLPGTWYKYYNGSFSEPGLGGESSPLDPTGALTRSWVSFSTDLNNYIGFSYIARNGEFAGFGFTMSPDGISNWAALPYLVLQTERTYWGPPDTELVEYPSLVSVYGDGDSIGSVFWLYYMYLNPGDDFQNRYLLRRKIWLTHAASPAPVDTMPRIALSKYEGDDDTWVTTTSTDPDYQFVEIMGYLFTEEVPNSVPVYDCYIDFWTDHMLVPNDATCGGGNVQYLRRVGWISTVELNNSVRVYRCFDAVATNHFISADPNCEGATTEWPMGYLTVQPPFPANEFVALSGYYDAGRQDNWATTASPPGEYAFESRFGYLLIGERADTIPLYDCYIDFWADHMLVPGDSTCDGAQNLGLIGWISTEDFPGSIPIYRCFDETATNHFVWLDPGCNGKTFEWRIGYLAADPLTDAFHSKVYLPAIMD